MSQIKVNIGIPQKSLDEIVDSLSVVLSTEAVLYQKTRNFHWNVGGPSFMELHKLFEEQYKKAEASIDVVAERISKLGHKTVGTLQEFGKLSIVKEDPGKYPSTAQMIQELLENHESQIQYLRECIVHCGEKHGDAGTADLLTALLREHETIAWTLRRYLA